jgi:hypothetical protein
MEHVPTSRQIGSSWVGTCSCGNWESGGLYPTAQKAEKVARGHAKSMLANLVKLAADQGHDPNSVIDAARCLCLHPDLAAVAWERGTTVIVVYARDMTSVYRYTLKADLTDVLTSERIRGPK